MSHPDTKSRIPVLNQVIMPDFAPEDAHKNVRINHARAILTMSRPFPTSKSNYLLQMAETWLQNNKRIMKQSTVTAVQSSNMKARQDAFCSCFACLLARNEVNRFSQSSISMLLCPSGKLLDISCWRADFMGIILGLGQTFWLLTLCIVTCIAIATLEIFASSMTWIPVGKHAYHADRAIVVGLHCLLAHMNPTWLIRNVNALSTAVAALLQLV